MTVRWPGISVPGGAALKALIISTKKLGSPGTQFHPPGSGDSPVENYFVRLTLASA